MRSISRPRRSGYTLIEVAVAVALLALVSTTALASLGGGLDSISGANRTARAVDAARGYAEYTYAMTLVEVDALDGSQTAPLLADGQAMPGAGSMMLSISVESVSDYDPATLVTPGGSSTRRVTLTATEQGQTLLTTSWLVTEL